MARSRKPPGFFARHRFKLVVGVLLLIGVVAFMFKGPSTAKTRVSEVVLLAPPPPPPPPPLKPPPPPKKIVEQTPTEKAPPKPAAAPGPKSPAAGLATSGHGGTVPQGGGGDGGGGGRPFDWYKTGVENAIRQSLKSNPVTRHSHMGITVRIWADNTGQITKATLLNSTGNPSLDDAIQQQVLLQTSLPGGPPEGLHMPLRIRISAP